MKLKVPAFTTVVTRLVIALALQAVYIEGTVVTTTKVSNAEKYQNAFSQGLIIIVLFDFHFIIVILLGKSPRFTYDIMRKNKQNY